MLAQAGVERLPFGVRAVGFGLAENGGQTVGKTLSSAGLPSAKIAARQPSKAESTESFESRSAAEIWDWNSTIRALFSSVGSSMNGAATRMRDEKNCGMPLSGTRLKASSKP